MVALLPFTPVIAVVQDRIERHTFMGIIPVARTVHKPKGEFVSVSEADGVRIRFQHFFSCTDSPHVGIARRPTIFVHSRNQWLPCAAYRRRFRHGRDVDEM